MSLVPVDTRTECPSCAGPIESSGATQLPLLRHGGCGAGLFRSWRQCRRCRWFLLHETKEVRP